LEKERRVDEQRGEDKKRGKFFGEQREASCRNEKKRETRGGKTFEKRT